jgi:hypothetical protein
MSTSLQSPVKIGLKMSLHVRFCGTYNQLRFCVKYLKNLTFTDYAVKLAPYPQKVCQRILKTLKLQFKFHDIGIGLARHVSP